MDAEQYSAGSVSIITHHRNAFLQYVGALSHISQGYFCPMLFLPLVIFALYTFKLFCPFKIPRDWLCFYSKTIKMKNLPFLKFTHTWGRECMEQYACELRINVNKYIFMIMIFCCLCIHWKKKRRNVASVWST